MSVPSRDLIIRKAPSTPSMVPRIRTVCGCCAHPEAPSTATSVSAATTARGINPEIFGMVRSPKLCCPGRAQNPAEQQLFLAFAPCGGKGPSHRRRQAVAADADAVGLKTAVGQFLHG